MKRFIILPLLIFVAGVALSQNSTLNEKWNNMLDKGETYENYKVIKKADLSEVWKSVQDTVFRLKVKLSKEEGQIKEQKSQVTVLQKNLEEINKKLEITSGEKDTMNFAGIQIDKYIYTTALWIIIFVILGGCGILFFLFQKSNKVTLKINREYEDISNKFEEYKHGKIETDRKLKREMQTYINKLEELSSRQKL